MAKTPKRPGRSRENVPVPTKRELTAGSWDLRRGDPAGGRVLAEKSAAKRQGAKPPRKK